MAEVILDLRANSGANLSAFHLVGHSLGAYIAGFAGKFVQNATGESVGRITGLDPAGPAFRARSADNRLAETDADLVVALHTDGGVNGYWRPLGDVDFYANGGFPPQPGCLEGDGHLLFFRLVKFFVVDRCSHLRAPAYLTESIYNPNGFLSVECDSYVDYILDSCSGSKNITLGGNFTSEDAGTYYFKTNAEEPYSLE